MRGLDFQRQYARKPARCRRSTVSGRTIFKASSTPGANRYNPANTRRSMLLKVRLAFALSIYAGLRVGEIAALRGRDAVTIDGSVRQEIKLSAHQTKGAKGRTVVLYVPDLCTCPTPSLFKHHSVLPLLSYSPYDST